MTNIFIPGSVLLFSRPHIVQTHLVELILLKNKEKKYLKMHPFNWNEVKT